MPAARPSPADLLEHKRDCPRERIESYELPTPGGGAATVTRCIDCGAHRADRVPLAAGDDTNELELLGAA